jgi:hypothetical protein
MWKGNIWGRGNMGNMMNNPGELNKADIEYAVRNDSSMTRPITLIPRNTNVSRV